MLTVVLSLRAVYEVAHIEGEKPGFLNRKIRAYRTYLTYRVYGVTFLQIQSQSTYNTHTTLELVGKVQHTTAPCRA